jgi:hypothetical protein
MVASLHYWLGRGTPNAKGAAPTESKPSDNIIREKGSWMIIEDR